jgi:hypothetical protein
MTLACPICRKQVKLGDPDFPFCSERCRLIDLGNWSAEKYRIPTTANPMQDEDEPDEN